MDTVTFGTKNSYTDFGLILSSKDIGFPQAKTKTIEIPGANGVIDLTDCLTKDIKYENRTLSFTFAVIDRPERWAAKLSEIANYLHGKKMKIFMDWDKNYYYEGRCSVNQFKSNKRTGSLVVDCDCDPYKYEENLASEPWIWDTFCFLDGIIYNNNIAVNGTKTVTLVNRRKVVTPTFKCTAPMTVVFDGVTYNLPKGQATISDIRLHSGENTITFQGVGTVQVDYERGSL